jgi:Asp-tRNA(Asn)/Glu-tRNA(Gln) amidotransferase A subunit family amidase
LPGTCLISRPSSGSWPERQGDTDPFRAESVGDTYAAFGLTLAANVAGLPALQIPGPGRDAAMDFGLQLIGPRMADVSVLAAGANLSTHIQGVSST